MIARTAAAEISGKMRFPWRTLNKRPAKAKRTRLPNTHNNLNKTIKPNTSHPALVKANRIQEKVAGVGFDWESPNQVWEKVEEELQEFKAEIEQGNQDAMESEFGDVLFSMINYARFLNVNPEDALERTNKKFIKRFMYLESKAGEFGKPLSDMTLAEMDVFWEEAKKLPNN